MGYWEKRVRAKWPLAATQKTCTHWTRIEKRLSEALEEPEIFPDLSHSQPTGSAGFQIVNQAVICNTFGLLPGDLCTLLLSNGENLEVFSTCVLVDSCWGTWRQGAAHFLWFIVFLDMSTCPEYIPESCKELEIVSKSAKRLDNS